MSTLIDLDNVTNCPRADRCEACGGEEDLGISTYNTQVGVYCATVCDACTDDGKHPKPTAVAAAVDRVLSHCEHLGIDADQMAAALRDEEADR